MEASNGVPHLLYFDKKSGAYYLLCHLDGKMLASKADIDAVLEPDESEDYKLNRELYEDTYAYKMMASDAADGRSFEDIVVEYDTGYRSQRPLKVFGGQHRIQAIGEALKHSTSVPHGVRVYFDLTVDQRVNIAMVNNTSIAVSNDLLDRMQEEALGSQLRDWCQSVGLLAEGQNFADRRSPDGIPTVRIARTLIVNYVLGKKARKESSGVPVVCTSGPKLDRTYSDLHRTIDWFDSNLATMGLQFTKLHGLQRERILKRKSGRFTEFANKAIHPCVTASWAFAAGYFQNFPAQNTHYALPDSCAASADPLNADVLLRANLKGVDSDAYRGLGARISGDELGRMLQLFLLQAESASKPGINGKLAETAIKAYEAKKAATRYEQALKGI